MAGLIERRPLSGCPLAASSLDWPALSDAPAPFGAENRTARLL